MNPLIRQVIGEDNDFVRNYFYSTSAVEDLLEALQVCLAALENAATGVDGEFWNSGGEGYEAAKLARDLLAKHCRTNHEKGVYSEDSGDTLRHKSCGGVVEYPETPLNEIVSWLRPGIEKARRERKARKAAAKPKAWTVGDSSASSLVS
jgi:hypothetical protein